MCMLLSLSEASYVKCLDDGYLVTAVKCPKLFAPPSPIKQCSLCITHGPTFDESFSVDIGDIISVPCIDLAPCAFCAYLAPGSC